MLILIIGCGGIGSALFQDLVRTNHVRNINNLDIVLVDGDRVERKNIGRQHFVFSQVGKFKAEALAETASVTLNLKNVYFANQYIRTEKDLQTIINPFLKKGTRSMFIFGCVDNHPARLIIEKFLKTKTNIPTNYIDCSNGLDEGEVISMFKNGEKIDGSFRSEFDPSVLSDRTDEKIEEVESYSCSDAIDEGNEQTIIANRKAAIIALELFDKIIQGEIITGIIRFKDMVIDRAVYKYQR